jgi:mono/diheme cytochrome c family protein
MAKDAEQGATNPGTTPDPIADTSLSGLLLVFSVLTFFSLVWAIYDELVAERPWKRYQAQFVSAYTSYLKKLGPQQAKAEKVVYSAQEAERIEQQLKAAEKAVAPRLSEIDKQLSRIRRRLAVMKDPFQDARARIAALIFELDHTEGEKGKKSIRQDIEELKKGPFRLAMPAESGGTEVQVASFTFADLEKLFADLKSREALLVAEQAAISKDVRELRAKRSQYLSDHLAGLNQQQVEGLLRKMRNFSIEIRQINIPEAGLVDRCESCHLGILEPLTLTAADMGGKQLFVSHPSKELLTLHDPTRFGCTPCHNGNGVATSSAKKAHGHYEHWLWPMFAKENAEAGCLQCHFSDRVLDNAPVLTRGRDLFQIKGCMGCHRHEEFDWESDALTAVRKETQSLENQQKEDRLEIDREIKKGDTAESNVEAQKHYATAERLRVTASNIDAKIGELDQRAKYLMQDQKKIGPNLKDVRLKLRKEWIPVWLKDPPAFRPGTKMPKFRLADDEIRAIAAFVWQSGLEGPKPPSQPKGDPVKGKELFETRGCMGCHSMGEDSRRMGGDFAANLSRLGEKAGYEYIVRWVHNPRERTRPYCPREKRDLGPEDYSRHNLPFVADLDHSACPNDGAQLQVQNMTVMPSLRLSVEEARDIATYVTSQKHNDASYADAAFMDDTRLAERGRQLTTRYGCANCHEIRGMEEAQRIGTELTKEGSKPIEQLDFGLLQYKAEKEGWYTHKGFFTHKLEDPAVFDQGKEKAPEDRLKMPNFQLAKEDIRALTTYLLGSMDSPFQGEFRTIPEQFRYIPTDQHKDVQDGWWVVKKYNCMGCHNIQVGQKSVLSGLARYQDPDWKEQLPPSLLQEGARVNPEWLSHFLANPALNEKDTVRNGVRTYLKARMPTFSFSPNEIRTLVRFFAGMAGQADPYIPAKLDPLSERERDMARALFSSRGAPCLKCHLVGDANHDRFSTAPNFLVAKDRLKPAWTARWMLDPQAISPGTAMPSGLFRREGDHWAFAGPTPEIFKGYTKDHVQLLVRYMFELTPEEQRRLTQMMPATASAKPGSSETRAAR